MDPKSQPETPWLLTLRLPEERPASMPAEATTKPAPPTSDADRGEPTSLPADTLGLAFSGSGIGSAAFCLGVLQSMARSGWLRRVDFLSTVAAGGGIGAFLGRFFDLSRSDAIPDQAVGAAQKRAAQNLLDARSPGIDWLRRHANYLAPSGLREAIGNGAALLSVYIVLAWYFLAVFCVINAICYSSPPKAVQSFIYELNSLCAPLSALLPPTMRGPWLGLAEFAFWLALAPLLIACLTVSADQPEAFSAPELVAVAILTGILLVATQNPLSIVVFAAAVLWTMVAWSATPPSEGRSGAADPIRHMRAYNHLIAWITSWFRATAALAAVGVVDALGRWFARWMLEGGLTSENVVVWFGSLGLIVIGLVSMVQIAERFLGSQTSLASRLWGMICPLAPVLLLAFGALPLLVAVSFASHVAFASGNAYWQGLGITVVAVVVSLLLSHGRVQFLHRSELLAMYGSRLARVFLGAVNPQRRLHPEGQDVTRTVEGDDVPFDEYHPELAGGPLHLINCALNETIDLASSCVLRDRPTENMAVGPAGINVAQVWHALWTDAPAGASELTALAPGGVPHPLLGPTGEPVRVERLDVSGWLAISGATAQSGAGADDGSVASAFFSLGKLRLGWWWDSGLSAEERRGVPMKQGLWPALGRCLARWFPAQGLLVSELTRRFAGPWRRYWYLSDGRNFEATGAYELLRRRVPFVIVCNAGADRDRQGSALAQLIRRVRVDFGAEIQEIYADPMDLQLSGIPDYVALHLGTLHDLCGTGGESPKKHAVLLLLRYPCGPNVRSQDPWLARKHTWLLYLKATLTGDEPADVRNYANFNPDFPNETQADHPLDESMWESYRKLGEHIGDDLFVL
jgi:hypothetical protein